jgi:hypothetical protein
MRRVKIAGVSLLGIAFLVVAVLRLLFGTGWLRG